MTAEFFQKKIHYEFERNFFLGAEYQSTASDIQSVKFKAL